MKNNDCNCWCDFKNMTKVGRLVYRPLLSFPELGCAVVGLMVSIRVPWSMGAKIICYTRYICWVNHIPAPMGGVDDVDLMLVSNNYTYIVVNSN